MIKIESEMTKKICKAAIVEAEKICKASIIEVMKIIRNILNLNLKREVIHNLVIESIVLTELNIQSNKIQVHL